MPSQVQIFCNATLSAQLVSKILEHNFIYFEDEILTS